MWFIVIMTDMLCRKEFLHKQNIIKISSFLAGSVSNTGYWRYDRLYYDKQHAESETVNFIGWTAKGGANFNISDHHNVFANIGYISRAPFFSYGAFLSAAVSNATNPNAVISFFLVEC